MIKNAILYPTDDELMILDLAVYTKELGDAVEKVKKVNMSKPTRLMADLIISMSWHFVIDMIVSKWGYKPVKFKETVLG